MKITNATSRSHGASKKQRAADENRERILQVAERLFVDEGSVKRYDTRLVFDTVKLGLALPTRSAPRRRR